MKTFKIVHREKLVGWYYINAETAEEALEEFEYQVSEGKIDISDLEMIDVENSVEQGKT